MRRYDTSTVPLNQHLVNLRAFIYMYPISYQTVCISSPDTAVVFFHVVEQKRWPAPRRMPGTEHEYIVWSTSSHVEYWLHVVVRWGTAARGGRQRPLRLGTQYSTVQYSTVQYSTVQYNTVQYSTVQYSTVQYSTVQYSTVQYSTVQYSTVQYSTVQYSTVQYSTLRYSSTVQYSTVQYSTVQYSTIQYSTVQYSILQYKKRQQHRSSVCTVPCADWPCRKAKSWFGRSRRRYRDGSNL